MAVQLGTGPNSFSLHSKWIGLSKRDPNSSVLRRDVESDRLIGNTAINLCDLILGKYCRLTDVLGFAQYDVK